MYSHDSATGRLTHVVSVGSPRGKDAHDGPRHVKIHPNGKILYCVTEHSTSSFHYAQLHSDIFLLQLT